MADVEDDGFVTVRGLGPCHRCGRRLADHDFRECSAFVTLDRRAGIETSRTTIRRDARFGRAMEWVLAALFVFGVIGWLIGAVKVLSLALLGDLQD